MPSIFDNNPALKNRMGQTNMAIASAVKAGAGAAVDAVVQIDIKLIEDMPGNAELFGYDEDQINAIADEVQTSGFHGVIEIIPNKEKAGRYTCVSGHQRIRALKKLGIQYVPCHVLKGLTDDQIRDYWRSANILHRKQTPYRQALLVKSYDEDYEASKKRPEGKIKGGKDAYAASRMHTAPSQIKRLRSILKFPDSIAKRCDDESFPYTVLITFKGDDAEDYESLNIALQNFDKKHSDNVVTADELRKIIAAVEKRKKMPEYGDIDPNEALIDRTGENGKEAQNFAKLQEDSFREHFSKIEDNAKGRDVQIIDEPLVGNVDSLYGLVCGGSYKTGNRVLVNQCIFGLKKILKQLESEKY